MANGLAGKRASSEKARERGDWRGSSWRVRTFLTAAILRLPPGSVGRIPLAETAQEVLKPPPDVEVLGGMFRIFAAIQRTVWPRRLCFKANGVEMRAGVAGRRILNVALHPDHVDGIFPELSRKSVAPSPPLPLGTWAPADTAEDARLLVSGLAALCAKGTVTTVVQAAADVQPGPGLTLERLLEAFLPQVPEAAAGITGRFTQRVREMGRPVALHDRTGTPCFQRQFAAASIEDLAGYAEAVRTLAGTLGALPGEGPARLAVWIGNGPDANWAFAVDGQNAAVLPQIMNDMALVLSAWRSSNQPQA